MAADTKSCQQTMTQCAHDHQICAFDCTMCIIMHVVQNSARLKGGTWTYPTQCGQSYPHWMGRFW